MRWASESVQERSTSIMPLARVFAALLQVLACPPRIDAMRLLSGKTFEELEQRGVDFPCPLLLRPVPASGKHLNLL